MSSKITQNLSMLTLITLIIFLNPSLSTFVEANQSDAPSGSTSEDETRIVHMPIVMKAFPRRNTIFGIEMYNIDNNNGLDAMLSAGAYWIRRNAFLWSHAEPKQGEYEPYSQPILREELINASNLGAEVILIVRSTPDWAREPGGKDCSRIKQDKLQAFGEFMKWAVERYSAPPYNVRYWQIWNEPDTPPSVAVPGGINGCWSDPSDPYYGDGYYADVLRAVYPKIKEANPEAKVLVGGLLLDCHPNDPDCNDPKQPLYLEGILASGGGDYFDVVAFHAYDHYFGYQPAYGNHNWDSSWDSTGPVVLAKAKYIRDLLAKYGVQGKSLMNTEGALLCGQSGQEPQCSTQEFQTTKAHYIAQLFAVSLAEGLQSNVWYTALGWRASGLFDSQLNPLPAYDAYRFAWDRLAGAKFIRQINDYSGVMGYEFQREGRSVWVLWSLGSNPHTIYLPQTPSGTWDVFGTPISVSGLGLDATDKPIYIEFTRW